MHYRMSLALDTWLGSGRLLTPMQHQEIRDAPTRQLATTVQKKSRNQAFAVKRVDSSGVRHNGG